MTIFYQFRRENSNNSKFLPIKIVNFDTKIKIDHFQAFQEFVVFGQKNGPLTHCVQNESISIFQFNKKFHHFQADFTVPIHSGRISSYVTRCESTRRVL